MDEKFLNKIVELQNLFDEGVLTTADNIPQPEPRQDVVDREAINRFMRDNPPGMADGGMLVKPSADGSRPGYAATKTATIKSKKLNKHKDKLIEQFNKIVLKDFEKEDLSKTKTWKQFLETKDLKGGSIGFYENMNREGIKVIYPRTKRGELADILIERANNDLKHTEWMDIQKKVSPQKRIDLKWKNYIERLDTKADKVNKAFDYLYDNDIKLKTPKNLTGFDVYERSLLRNVISDLTGVKSNKVIRAGLNNNDAFIKNKDLIDFAATGRLFKEREGNTLREILSTAEYRKGGNIEFSSDIKRFTRANKNVFDYALRNFNYHQKYKTGRGTITFYDAKTNEPIIWDDVPLNENGFKSLKPSDVYFIDSTQQGPKTKWTLSTIDADNEKWSKGKKTSKLFDEVFQAKDTYDKLLNTKVTDPLNPKGKKITFQKLMEEVYQVGFDNFGNPYSIEHGSGVSEKPFKNLSIASQRVNSALYHLERNKNLSTSELSAIRKQLNKGVFPTKVKNTDLRIKRIIDSTQQLQKDVLIKGKKFTLSEIQTQIAALSSDPSCSVFKKGRVGKSGGGDFAKLNSCVAGGVKAINEGKIPNEKATDFLKLLKGGSNVVRNVAKYGVLPEAFLFTADALARTALGDTWKEAGLRASDYLLPGDQKKEADIAKVSRIFNDRTGELVGKSIDYKNTVARINNLEAQRKNLETTNVPSDFGYFDNTSSIKNLDATIAQAKKDLDTKFFVPLEQRLFADRKLDEAYDESMAASDTMKKLGAVRETSEAMKDTEDFSGLQSDAQAPTSLNLDPSLFPNFRKDMEIAKTLGSVSAEEAKRYFEGRGESPDEFLEYQKSFENLKKLPLSNLAQIYGDEQIYGTQGASALGEPLAEGGIAGLSGGDKSGPPPERGPNSEGLSSLLKRGTNI